MRCGGWGTTPPFISSHTHLQDEAEDQAGPLFVRVLVVIRRNKCDIGTCRCGLRQIRVGPDSSRRSALRLARLAEASKPSIVGDHRAQAHPRGFQE